MNEQLKEAISEAIRQALGGALDCTRVWSAWSVGTMSEDDFSPVADDSERVGEIADAVMAVLATRKLVCETCSGWGMIGGPSFYAPDEGGEPCPDCNARHPVGQEPNGKLVAWWNGITPGYDGQGNWSIRWGADAENSGHDIPLYDGINPIHYQQPAHAVDLGPRPMETAPRDGTMVRLLVQFEDHATEDTDGPAWTIGANNDDNEGVGWQFAGWCWTHDHFTEGKGTPVGWLPLIDSQEGRSDDER